MLEDQAEDFSQEFEDNNEQQASTINTAAFSDYMAEFNRPKEEMDLSNEPTREELGLDEEPTLSKQKCRQTAKFLSSTLDTTAAYAISLIDKEDYTKHKAEPSALKDLENIMCEYLMEAGADIPLWVKFIICIFTLYVVQIPGALYIRRQKKALPSKTPDNSIKSAASNPETEEAAESTEQPEENETIDDLFNG